MDPETSGKTRTRLIWLALAAALAVPIALAAASPLLAWRSPVYIAAGFAGVIAMALLLLQPLLAGGYLPGLSAYRGRHIHRWVGIALVSAVVIHVAALWITSPPDVVDALLFRSPTPFSAWGVIAMWAVFAAAFVAATRPRLRLRPRTWRLVHTSLATIVVVGSVVHALLIEGTMETVSKVALCTLVVIATLKVITDLKVWAVRANGLTRPVAHKERSDKH
ncbi:ferric reductase-like transmembrane domain-containing protein [Hoeflea prorocentri]|uniref:Ferric reductase-like transmembrane domain-containing protein n=1 Tax=Hoeflea prorocentri TaxID=1922333 RepID=A0A9X3ZJ23_9HYPH|nr:ferric reductase-like transmembrane domain-containing protein [Hoeflea prorocentri]MCY6382588.1 ferric reductase-like transmembrane domain-containing protein [Hoeflea prorocentri]MDA5400388.1 ferric reductase-like transmembrane domain-containing protein [Hoeflea prorocentri]